MPGQSDVGKIPFQAVVFDLDGVITKTAIAHAESWEVMFDEYLRVREERDGEPFQQFSYENDYLPYIDGRPRYKGVQCFLDSRGISLPFGDPSDRPDQETCCGLGNKKDVVFHEILKRDGIEQYQSTVRWIKELKEKGVHVGVASSSKNCQLVLQTTGLAPLFETRVDGIVSAEKGLHGKPEPDIFIVAAKNMGVGPADAVVVEDAAAGVQAGRKGEFGLVIGVAREGNEKELKESGADIVIKDFEGVDTAKVAQWFLKKSSGQ